MLISCGELFLSLIAKPTLPGVSLSGAERLMAHGGNVSAKQKRLKTCIITQKM